MKQIIFKIKKRLICRKINAEIKDLLYKRKYLNDLCKVENMTFSIEEQFLGGLAMMYFYPSKIEIYHKLKKRREIIHSIQR